MNSRQEILNAVRGHALPEAELPDLEGGWIRYDDVTSQFTEMLVAVGGQAVRTANLNQVTRHLREVPAFQSATNICSLVPGLDLGNRDPLTIDDPHQLADVDFAILPAEFGVAENGAVWLDDRQLKHRVLPFITQHLTLVLPSNQLCHNMHQAYERLTFGACEFGVFISGPSKTADIEQSLVIGAHGARSLTVFLVG